MDNSLSLISLFSEPSPDILPVCPKLTPDVSHQHPCKQRWHIHPFCCYCAQSQLLRETAAGHCLFSRLSNVSKWSGKQTALNAALRLVWPVWGRTQRQSDFSLSLSVPPLWTQFLRDTMTEDILPRMDRWWSESNKIIFQEKNVLKMWEWKHHLSSHIRKGLFWRCEHCF